MCLPNISYVLDGDSVQCELNLQNISPKHFLATSDGSNKLWRMSENTNITTDECDDQIFPLKLPYTKSLGARWAPTSSLRPFEPALDLKH